MNFQGQMRPADCVETDSEWWRGASIYQIYPRSFADSNDDGVGDLPGVVSRLDYIRSLGVDAIWLSPFYKSPMRDFGYDVADYCDVDPIFGSLADFDALVARAHALGLKVIVDQVYSHTSDQHLGSRKASGIERTPRPIGMSGPTPSRMARRRAIGKSVFGGPGVDMVRAARTILSAQFPARAAGSQCTQCRRAGRAARRRRASGSTAESTVFVSMPSIS